MFAIIRKNTYDPTKLAHAGPALAEFQALHAAQPGYAGSIDIDVGDGQRIVVNLWRTEQDARADLEALVPHLQRLLEPLMAGPLAARRVRRSGRERPHTAAVDLMRCCPPWSFPNLPAEPTHPGHDPARSSRLASRSDHEPPSEHRQPCT